MYIKYNRKLTVKMCVCVCARARACGCACVYYDICITIFDI